MCKIQVSVPLLAGVMAFGQQQDSTRTSDIDEIIIGRYIRKNSSYSNKMPLKAIEDPQVYSSIDKAVLEDQLITNVDDAFRNVTGVQRMWSATNRAGDGGNFINLRGFVGSSSLRNGMIAPVTTVADAINIEKVEVLKGPAATLFGSSVTSYGGLVNRVTKKPAKDFRGTISLLGGSYHFYRVQADVNAPLTKDESLLFRLNTAYTNQGTFQKEDAKNEYYAFTPALTFRPNDRLELNAELEIFQSNAYPETGFFFYFPSSVLGFDNMKDAKNFGYDYQQSYMGDGLKTQAKVHNLFGEIGYKINNNIKLTTNVSSSYSYSDGFNPYFYMAPKQLPPATPPILKLEWYVQTSPPLTVKVPISRSSKI